MSERNYLLPLVAIAIGVFFLAVLVTGIVFWNRMPVIVSAPPPTTATPPVVATPPPISTPTPTPIPTPTLTAESRHRTVPQADVTLSAPTSTLPNATNSIARLRPGFRSCYNRGLTVDPSLHGEITITIVVAANGDITSVTKKSGGLSPDVDACILRRARGGTFDASASGTTLDVPVRFEHVN